MRHHRDVAEQVVVVFGTNGAVGRATALAALERGARVVAAGSDRHALAALATEAAAPHRFETVPIGGDADVAEDEIAAHVAHVATSRFGLLHTWVHIVSPVGADASSVPAVAGPVLRQLRRSGGGTFVVVAPEPDVLAGSAAPGRVDIDRDLAHLDAERARHDLASVALVRRRGIVAPDLVARTVLRSAVRPRRETVVQGSARREALVARVAPAGARRHRPHGAWLLR